MFNLMMLLAASDDGKAAPTVLWLDEYGWVALAMTVLLGLVIYFKVPKMLLGGLDAKIAEIKKQLDDAKALRAEAEALRDEYAAKIAGAEKDAEAMLQGAQAEADAILAQAESESAKMVDRRKRMAEDKIAAAEREALDSVRQRAVEAAALASKAIIADTHTKAADSKLADEVISQL